MLIGPNYVYIHVPKTSGSSFEKMMWERHGNKVWGEQHNTAACIKPMHRDRFIFGFMRNPIHADVSEWKYCTLAWNHTEEFTYENWCRWRYGGEPESFGETMLSNPANIHYGWRFQHAPQAGYFCNENGRCIADKIYRFENHAEAMRDITEQLGLNCSIDEYNDMTYSHSRGRDDYMRYTTDETIELLYKAKEIDFLLTEGDDPIMCDYKFTGNIDKLTKSSWYGNYLSRQPLRHEDD